MSFLQTLTSIFKNSNINISGKWTGAYGFGENYSEKVRSQTIRFTAKISGEDANFTGTIQEIDGQISELAEISGKVNGKKISFTKTYKEAYQIDEEGTVEKMPHGPQHIIYEGLYDKTKLKFHGQWRIEAIYIYEGGRKVERVSTGNWEMTRD